jgi:hypothetical protein
MLQSASPVIQALLGTLMTWGLTALGASVAFFVKGNQVLFLLLSSKLLFLQLLDIQIDIFV